MKLVAALASAALFLPQVAFAQATPETPQIQPKKTDDLQEQLKELKTISPTLKEIPELPAGIKPGSKEEEQYYKQLYLKILPIAEAKLKEAQEVLKSEDYHLLCSIGKKNIYLNSFKRLELWEKIDEILDPLFKQYEFDNKISPSEAEIKKIQDSLVPKKSAAEMAEEFKKTSAKLLKKMQDPSLSSEELMKISARLDKINKAQADLRTLEKVMDERRSEISAGFYLKAKRVAIQQTIDRQLIDKYKLPALYETKKGAIPLEAYAAFVKDQATAKKIMFNGKPEEDLYMAAMKQAITESKRADKQR